MIASVTTLIKLVFVLSLAAFLKSCTNGTGMAGGSAKKNQASAKVGAQEGGSDLGNNGGNDADSNGQDLGATGKPKQRAKSSSKIEFDHDEGNSGAGENPNGTDLGGRGQSPFGANSNDALIKNDPQFKNLFNEQFVIDGKSIKRPLDLIVVLDTSGSMGEEAVKVQQNIGVLTQSFGKEVGLDYRIWVMAGGITIPGSDPQKVSIINQEVDSNDSLLLLTNLLSGVIPMAVPFRMDTQKAIVVVSDDNAEGITAPGFIATLQADRRFMNKTSVNGLVWLAGVSKESPTCSGAAPGAVYEQLAKAKETAGAVYDLCADNWNPLFTDLAKKLVQQTVTLEYKLKQNADPAGGFAVGVNGTKLDPSTYRFDKALNAIVFAEGKTPSLGSMVVVGYKPI